MKDFFSKCDQIPSFLRIWSHLPKKSLMGNFNFSAMERQSNLFHHVYISNKTHLEKLNFWEKNL